MFNIYVFLHLCFQERVSSKQISWTERQTGNWRWPCAAHRGCQQWGYGFIITVNSKSRHPVTSSLQFCSVWSGSVFGVHTRTWNYSWLWRRRSPTPSLKPCVTCLTSTLCLHGAAVQVFPCVWNKCKSKNIYSNRLSCRSRLFEMAFFVVAERCRSAASLSVNVWRFLPVSDPTPE